MAASRSGSGKLIFDEKTVGKTYDDFHQHEFRTRDSKDRASNVLSNIFKSTAKNQLSSTVHAFEVRDGVNLHENIMLDLPKGASQ